MPMSTLFQDIPTIQAKPGGMLDAQSQVAQTRGNELQNQQREQVIAQQGIDNERANQDAMRKQQANDILKQYVDMKTGDVDWKGARSLVAQVHPEYAMQLDDVMNKKRAYTQDAEIKDLEARVAKTKTQIELAAAAHDQTSYNMVYPTIAKIAQDNGTPPPPTDFSQAGDFLRSAEEAKNHLSGKYDKTKQQADDEKATTPQIQANVESQISKLNIPEQFKSSLLDHVRQPGNAVAYERAMSEGVIKNEIERNSPQKPISEIQGLRLSQAADQRDVDRFTSFNKHIDPSAAPVRSALGVAKNGFERAERLESLAKAFKNGNNLRDAEIEELAIGLNAMLTGGAQGARSQVEALVPKTAIGNVSKLKQFLTNNPEGMNQKKFVDRIAGTIEREKNTMAEQMKRAQFARISAYSDLADVYPQRFNESLLSNNIDPEEYAAWKAGGSKTISAVQKPEGSVVAAPVKIKKGEVHDFGGGVTLERVD